MFVSVRLRARVRAFTRGDAYVKLARDPLWALIERRFGGRERQGHNHAHTRAHTHMHACTHTNTSREKNRVKEILNAERKRQTYREQYR